jgi:hypothetical protein
MDTPTWFHVTARLAPGMPDLCTEETGAWLWPRLREAFPASIATSLMPSHPHVMPATADPEAAMERLARLLGQLGRRHGVMGRASKVKARAVEDLDALRRNIRYIALNPCRAKLVRCPLAWHWSTHRDVIGATLDPWVNADRLAAAVAEPREGFIEAWHRYVSADSSAAVDGTPMPVAATPNNMSWIPLRRIAEAVVSATRTSFDALKMRGQPRAIFFALALEQGWTQTERLADLCNCKRRRVRELAASVPESTLAIARLCLGDERLRMLPRPAPPPPKRDDRSMPFEAP